jgi:hypothetical protein
MAMINGNYDLGLVLLQRGADLNKAAADGVAPLFAVISNYWGAKTRYPAADAPGLPEGVVPGDHGSAAQGRRGRQRSLKKDQWYLVYTFGSLGWT